MGSHFLLQGIFLTQGSNPHLSHWQADSLPLHHLGFFHARNPTKGWSYKGEWATVLSLEDLTAQWEKSACKSAVGEVYIGGSTCTGPVEVGWWGKHRRLWWSAREDFLEVEDFLSCVLLYQKELAKQSGRRAVKVEGATCGKREINKRKKGAFDILLELEIDSMTWEIKERKERVEMRLARKVIGSWWRDWVAGFYPINQESANVFWKETSNLYLTFCESCSHCHNHSALLLQHKTSQRQYGNELTWLCSNKTLFTKIGSGLDCLVDWCLLNLAVNHSHP